VGKNKLDQEEMTKEGKKSVKPAGVERGRRFTGGKIGSLSEAERARGGRRRRMIGRPIKNEEKKNIARSKKAGHGRLTAVKNQRDAVEA